MLRSKQAESAQSLKRGIADPTVDMFRVVLQQLGRDVENAVQDPKNPAHARPALWRLQTERWSLTRDIVERIRPGPYENSAYLLTLAEEAAAIEGYLRREAAPPLAGLSEFASRTLIGTTNEPLGHARSSLVGGRYVVVMVSGAMMDFLYQAAKAVVLSWNEETPPKGWRFAFSGSSNNSAGSSGKASSAQSALSADLLQDAIGTWLYDGYPRLLQSALPPTPYIAPLAVLTTFAERFVLAHEYSHVIFDHLRQSSAEIDDEVETEDSIDDKRAKRWRLEARADIVGARILAASAALYDGAPAITSLTGAAFAMKSYELWEQALQIAVLGDRHWLSGTDRHPPFEWRRELLERVYAEADQDHDEAPPDLASLFLATRTLDQLWERVAPRLQAQFRAGRRPHSTWASEERRLHLQSRLVGANS